ncbi:MAG: CPBP family intramembrane glutamic endopeptidase [Candidatus Promineifilaceae bacterium]|nr:CPBP family intramembrane glutamic endopeptidase [Candidatus Promineifilaceae bacterium]
MTQSLVWNATENRLRAGWRLLIQSVLFAVPTLSLSLAGVYTMSDWLPATVTATMLPLTLVSVYLLGRFVDRRHFSDYGLQLRERRWWSDYGTGLLIGVLATAVFANLVDLLGWGNIRQGGYGTALTGSPIVAVLIGILTYAGVGIFEELLRAYQIRNLSEGLAGGRLGTTGALLAGVFGAALWSVLAHAASGDSMFLVYILVTSMIYGLFFLWTGRAALAMSVHFAWDFAMSHIFAFGTFGGTRTSLFVVTIHGNHEVGFQIVGITAKLVILLLVALWVRWREGRIQLHKELNDPTLVQRMSIEVRPRSL